MCIRDSLNDNPPIFSTSNTLDIEENIKTISTITAVDADGDSLVFSLKPNINDNSELIITPDGILSFVTPADYETRILYTGTIIVTDGVFSDELTIAINVTDANDNPPVIITTGFSSNENQSSIGLIEATDVDTNTVFSYSITGNDASYVSVNNDGVISFIELPDYETKSSYSITIDVSDGLNATSKGIIVQINNILEDVISSSFTISDGTSSQPPILNISLKLDELSGAKKVYAQLEAIAETDDIGCYGSTGAMELAKNNLTDWTLTKELPSETSELCSYRVNYYFNFYDIETESVPPTPGIHLATGNNYSSIPANLRMQYMSKHKMSKPDFEMLCLAVAAIIGCGKCINAHDAILRNNNISSQSIQTVVRVAAIINAISSIIKVSE